MSCDNCEPGSYCQKLNRYVGYRIAELCGTEKYHSTLIKVLKKKSFRREGKPVKPKRIECIYLGPIIDRADCNCPGKFTYACDHEIAGPTTMLGKCRGCPHYEPDDQAKRLD